MDTYLIYSYEIKNNVYIGLTKNIIVRDKSHRTDTLEKDTLKKFCFDNNFEIPEPKILETGLTPIESQVKENDWLNYYKDNGYNIINKAETGIYKSSLGGGKKKNFKERDRKRDITIFGKYNSLTLEEVIEKMKEYFSKTDMYKKNHGFYEYCRLNNLLVYFPPRKKDNDRYNKTSHNIPLSVLKDAIEIPSYPSFYYLEKNDCVYKKLKTKINQVKPQTKDSKIVYYHLYNTVEKTMVPYHEIIRKIYNEETNACLYIDNDLSNINKTNFKFLNYDIKTAISIDNSDRYFINEDGLIYDKKHKYCYYGEKHADGFYFKNENVDKIMCKVFLKEKNITIKHKDNNCYNNKLNNLEIIKNKNKNNFIIKFKNRDTYYDVNIEYNEKKYEIGKFSDITLKKEIENTILKRFYNNNNIDEWVEDYKINEFTSIKLENKKRTTDKIRAESCGCYWWKEKKCWKSKIYYNNKEYSLGYFDTFEKGKALYEIASIMIKYGCFFNWYKEIVQQRKTINKIL